MDVKIYASPDQKLKNQQDGKTSTTILKPENTEQLNARNCSISPKYSTTSSQAIGVGGAFESDGWVSRAEVNGDIETELTIDEFKLYLEACGFKSEEKNEGGGSGTTQNKNLEFKYSESDEKPLTIYKHFKSDKIVDVAKECLVSSIKLNTTLQAYLTASVSVVGKEFETIEENGNEFKPEMEKHEDTGTDKVKKSGSLKCLNAVIKETTKNGSSSNNDKDITAMVESIDITIDRKLEAKGALNSIYTKSIKPNGKGEVTLNLQFNEFDKDNYKKAQEMLKNNTSYEVEFEVADDLDKERKINIKFPKVKISNVEATNLEGAGGISKEMKAYTPEGKEQPFEIKIINYKNNKQ